MDRRLDQVESKEEFASATVTSTRTTTSGTTSSSARVEESSRTQGGGSADPSKVADIYKAGADSNDASQGHETVEQHKKRLDGGTDAGGCCSGQEWVCWVL
jgi:hypothetical protein